ncbi:hypothetical protein E1B28_005397 [Marasmius oreades]|uniref:DUF6699 domain-containing protein n=1 Tax=Marasmius oreades TaxID=181124 RepID=A0A9P7S324_9AGAR|nr:uncharacterized protein E1B28_005397 [Marasmius oreades]KAG7094569.1 hypothetical protein E1B28_005397 [Marasmius oreades]
MPAPVHKRVRFSKTRTEYTILANAPPSYASSSLPSSNGPVTPPSYQVPLPGHSHYSYPPKSKPVKQPPHAHSLLAHCGSHQPQLNFDVTLPISSMTARYRPLPTPLLSEPAITPVVPSLVLTTHLLPWSITIYASNGYYVTVRDVLEGIYRALRKNVTHKEYNSIPSHPDRARVNEAYERRYSRVRDYYASREEKQGGVKRVDFLRGRTRFMGISPSGRANIWELRLDYH